MNKGDTYKIVLISKPYLVQYQEGQRHKWITFIGKYFGRSEKLIFFCGIEKNHFYTVDYSDIMRKVVKKDYKYIIPESLDFISNKLKELYGMYKDEENKILIISAKG